MDYIDDNYRAFLNHSKNIEVTKRKSVPDPMDIENICAAAGLDPIDILTESYSIYFNTHESFEFLRTLDVLFNKFTQEIRDNLKFPENTEDENLKYLKKIIITLLDFNEKVKSDQGNYRYQNLVLTIPETIRDLVVIGHEIKNDATKLGYEIKLSDELKAGSDNEEISKFLYDFKLRLRKYIEILTKIKDDYKSKVKSESIKTIEEKTTGKQSIINV